MKTDTLFHDICAVLDLGNTIYSIEKLTGGYMHQMYHLQTEKGQFAIKLLNPNVMKRPHVFDHYKLADELEIKLQHAAIPIVPALTFNRKKMQCVHGQYFYVFHFVDGKALRANEIQVQHCNMIGSTLAKIHMIERKQETLDHNETTIDWDYYMKLAYKKCPEIVSLLFDHRTLLYSSQQKAIEANKMLPNITCICNGDMDCKNVLWMNNHPYIIDLESLNYGNPFVELLELALCWSGYEQCCVNDTLLEAFLSAYRKEYGNITIDWRIPFYSNNGRLLWLEYNVKRALLIECESHEEQLLGIHQIKQTMEQLLYYDAISAPLIAKLNHLFS